MVAGDRHSPAPPSNVGIPVGDSLRAPAVVHVRHPTLDGGGGGQPWAGERSPSRFWMAEIRKIQKKYLKIPNPFVYVLHTCGLVQGLGCTIPFRKSVPQDFSSTRSELARPEYTRLTRNLGWVAHLTWPILCTGNGPPPSMGFPNKPSE
jgi:hypothetical protein